MSGHLSALQSLEGGLRILNFGKEDHSSDDIGLKACFLVKRYSVAVKY
jgi:hypothetical protein